jgi:hypothetical protein
MISHFIASELQEFASMASMGKPAHGLDSAACLFKERP